MIMINCKVKLHLFTNETLHMSCYMTGLCKLFVTLITNKHTSFMYGLNMSSKSTLFYSFIVTLITAILDTFMF